MGEGCICTKTNISWNHFLGIEGEWAKDKIPVTMINVYAPCELNQKKELWRELIQVMTESGDKWCIMGDFNSIRNESERKGVITRDRHEEIRCFEEFIAEAEFVDLPMVGRKYTWYRSDGLAMS